MNSIPGYVARLNSSGTWFWVINLDYYHTYQQRPPFSPEQDPFYAQYPMARPPKVETLPIDYGAGTADPNFQPTSYQQLAANPAYGEMISRLWQQFQMQNTPAPQPQTNSATPWVAPQAPATSLQVTVRDVPVADNTEARLIKIEQDLNTLNTSVGSVLRELAVLRGEMNTVKTAAPVSEGGNPRKGSRAKTTYTQYLQIMGLKNSGKTVAEIANTMGMPWATVDTMIKWDDKMIAKKKQEEDREKEKAATSHTSEPITTPAPVVIPEPNNTPVTVPPYSPEELAAIQSAGIKVASAAPVQGMATPENPTGQSHTPTNSVIDDSLGNGVTQQNIF